MIISFSNKRCFETLKYFSNYFTLYNKKSISKSKIHIFTFRLKNVEVYLNYYYKLLNLKNI